MSALVEIQCPYCRVNFKLNSRKPLGKEVSCPQCQHSFIAREIAQPITDVFEEEIEDYDAAPIPPRESGRKPRASQPRRRKGIADEQEQRLRKRKSNKSLKLALIIGGCFLGTALIGLTIWLIFGGGISKKLDLAWLPEDAHYISVARYSEMWKSRLVQDSLTEKTKRDIEAMENKWGFEPKDIESVIVAHSARDRIQVVRTKIDLDERQILKNAGRFEKAEYEGETYYRIGQGGVLRSALYFPDSRTAISGSEQSVKNAIDRGAKAEPRDDFKFIDFSQQVLTVFVNRTKGNRVGNSVLPLHKINVTAIGTTVTSSIETTHQIKFETEQDARDFEEQIKNPGNLKNLGPGWKHLGGLARSIPNGSISRNGDVVVTKLKFTPPRIFRTAGLFMYGTTMGVSTIGAVARHPGRLFGIHWVSALAQRQVVQVDFRDFHGRGDADRAAREAIRDLPQLDKDRTQLLGGRMQLYFKMGRPINMRDIKDRIRRSGFRTVNVRSLGVKKVE